MIEVLLKNKTILKAESMKDIPVSELDFHIIQILDYSDSDINWFEKNIGLDLSIMKSYEDIEISSHFLENGQQAAFHFSIPYYNKERKMMEEPIFIVIAQSGLFLFSSSGLDNFFNETYSSKHIFQKISDDKSMFRFQFEFITDYFADITENLTRKIKALTNTVLIEKEFSSKEMDTITTYNFNNLLIKESLMETTRVFRLYLKSNWEKKVGLRESVENELQDLTVVSDYIQFNFDRLDDLKENITSKIDLEQNHIFKMLTVATVCISLPTLIAGIYGMNFENMPELNFKYGYPVTILAMITSAVLPFLYFKKKKWF